tara:strand:+ start:319 stop:966 length:648 start_codon:yes stop_codon:yes gene_type:complete
MAIDSIGIAPINTPKIDVQVINAPTIRHPVVPISVPIGFPIIEMPCVDARRAGYENEALVENDPQGNVIIGECNVPSYTPMQFTPNDFTYVESDLSQDEEQEAVKPFTPEIPTDKKEEEIFFVECPGPKDQRVGDFRNEKRLERVKGHKLSDNERECITLYEPVTFVEQYLPSGATASFTAATALVAATTPLLIPVIKSAVKTIVKKITSRKKKE